jgi:transposase-like protein
MKTIAIKRYIEAFKLQVVNVYERDQSVRALPSKYSITGKGTVERWVKQYGHAGLRKAQVSSRSHSRTVRPRFQPTRIVRHQRYKLMSSFANDQ